MGQSQPDPEVAISIGQDSLDKAHTDAYNPLIKVGGCGLCASGCGLSVGLPAQTSWDQFQEL